MAAVCGAEDSRGDEAGDHGHAGVQGVLEVCGRGKAETGGIRKAGEGTEDKTCG